MTLNKKILLVGSQHGDETLGSELFEYLQLHFANLMPSIEYICANPRAYEQETRFIESDMNRSYALKNEPRPYEELQADRLLKHIAENNYDYVLDIHTTTTDVGLCLIFASSHLSLLPRITNAASITNIVIIPDSITKHSLIGNQANSFSIECNDSLSEDLSTLEVLSELVERLADNKEGPVRTRELYYVDAFIDPQAQYDYEKLENFVLAPNNRYPILSGGKANRTYRGFWASRKQSVNY